jgi:hypothetical protein
MKQLHLTPTNRSSATHGELTKMRKIEVNEHHPWCLKDVWIHHQNPFENLAPKFLLCSELIKVDLSECLLISQQLIPIYISQKFTWSLSYQMIAQPPDISSGGGFADRCPTKPLSHSFSLFGRLATRRSLQATTTSSRFCFARYLSLQATSCLLPDFVSLAFLQFLAQKPVKRVRIKIY